MFQFWLALLGELALGGLILCGAASAGEPYGGLLGFPGDDRWSSSRAAGAGLSETEWEDPSAVFSAFALEAPAQVWAAGFSGSLPTSALGQAALYGSAPLGSHLHVGIGWLGYVGEFPPEDAGPAYAAHGVFSGSRSETVLGLAVNAPLGLSFSATPKMLTHWSDDGMQTYRLVTNFAAAWTSPRFRSALTLENLPGVSMTDAGGTTTYPLTLRSVGSAQLAMRLRLLGEIAWSRLVTSRTRAAVGVEFAAMEELELRAGLRWLGGGERFAPAAGISIHSGSSRIDGALSFTKTGPVGWLGTVLEAPPRPTVTPTPTTTPSWTFTSTCTASNTVAPSPSPTAIPTPSLESTSTSALARREGAVTVLIESAEEALSAGRIPAARGLIQAALELDPTNPRARQLLQRIKDRRGDW